MIIKEEVKKHGILQMILDSLPPDMHEHFLQVADGIIHEYQEIYNDTITEINNADQQQSKSEPRKDINNIQGDVGESSTK